MHTYIDAHNSRAEKLNEPEPEALGGFVIPTRSLPYKTSLTLRQVLLTRRQDAGVL